jgi:hypothetical protein
MFQEPPGAVWNGWNRAAAEGGWNLGHRLVEVEVGAAASEEIEDMFAKRLVRIGSHADVSVERFDLSSGVWPNER